MLRKFRVSPVTVTCFGLVEFKWLFFLLILKFLLNKFFFSFFLSSLAFIQAICQMLINLVRSDKSVYVFVNYEDQGGPKADMKRV